MSVNYALAEGSERNFMQLAGQKKSAVGMLYGDMLSYDRAADNWIPAVAASVRPFGLCGTTDLLTQTTNNITGVITTTRGAAASDTHCSVIVRCFIKRAADGAIPPGEYVMLSATAPLTEVAAWNGTLGTAVVGRYVRNITQHDNIALAAAVDNDIIIIEFDSTNAPETGTGA
jgi:hypothetical protein